MKFRRLPLCLLALLLCSCNVQLIDETQEFDLVPDMVIGDFSYLSLNAEGHVEWELKAENAKMYTDDNSIYLFNMTMTVFDENNAAESFVSGNEGFLDKMNMDAVVEGDVEILSDNGVILESEKVYWDNEDELFYTVEGDLVTLTRGRTVINGYELVADAALEEVTFQDVIGKIQQDD